MPTDKGPPEHVPGTTKGEEKGLDMTEEEQRQDREDIGVAPSKPISDDMPDMGPADQGS
ncbi:MAG: hypothetical protein ACRDQ5_18200 [Sciscionella sp.]